MKISHGYLLVFKDIAAMKFRKCYCISKQMELQQTLTIKFGYGMLQQMNLIRLVLNEYLIVRYEF